MSKMTDTSALERLSDVLILTTAWINWRDLADEYYGPQAAILKAMDVTPFADHIEAGSLIALDHTNQIIQPNLPDNDDEAQTEFELAYTSIPLPYFDYVWRRDNPPSDLTALLTLAHSLKS